MPILKADPAHWENIRTLPGVRATLGPTAPTKRLSTG